MVEIDLLVFQCDELGETTKLMGQFGDSDVTADVERDQFDQVACGITPLQHDTSCIRSKVSLHKDRQNNFLSGLEQTPSRLYSLYRNACLKRHSHSNACEY